jgi:serine protease Do
MNRKLATSMGLISIGIIISVVFLFSGGYNLIYGVFSKDQIGASNPPVVINPQAKAMNDAMVEVCNAVIPTVVSISVKIEVKEKNQFNDPMFKQFFEYFGQPMPMPDEGNRQAEGSGSGVIITSDGYIITNNHVIDNATKITVKTNDKKEYIAKLIGKDPSTDLAVIKIEAHDLTPAHFANIEDVKIGEMVVAVGNPLGLNSTVTSGIVSAIGRGGLNLAQDKTGFNVEYLIQTDAAINPGNSGGGLFSLDGSLIGINSAIATRTGTYIGYGFAIPVDLVHTVVVDLIENGKINRGFVGVRIQTVDETIAKSVGLDDVEGALVIEVLKGQAASKAGIEIGDVILEVDGKKINSSNELQSVIVTRKAGDVVRITLWRDGKKIDKSVKLEPRDSESDLSSNDNETEKGDDNGNATYDFDKLGFSVGPLTSENKKDLDVKGGAMITKVKRYSVAESRGLASNGVIVKADRERIDNPGELNKIIKSKKAGEPILLVIKYKNASRVVAMEIPDNNE